MADRVPIGHELARCDCGDCANERRRRELLVARSRGADASELRELSLGGVQRMAAGQLERARAAADAAAIASAAARDRPKPKLTNQFDPGAEKRAWAREGERDRELRRAIEGEGEPSGLEPVGDKPRRPSRRRRVRRWKVRPVAESAALIAFATERAWTTARRHALATRIKRNDGIIAHVRAAEAAWRKLQPWAAAAVRRAMHAQQWSFGDQAARRHVALWATLEEFARARAYVRPRRSSSGPSRFYGIPKFGMAVVGWTQSALALAISGPDTTDGGEDPLDPKTVQRHVELAEIHGALHVVRRNPDAEPELRGRPTPTNPRGWPINAYWVPEPGFMKPGFTGQHFDAEGNAIGLEEALALPLVPRVKRPRRLREQHAQPPPPAA